MPTERDVWRIGESPSVVENVLEMSVDGLACPTDLRDIDEARSKADVDTIDEPAGACARGCCHGVSWGCLLVFEGEWR